MTMIQTNITHILHEMTSDPMIKKQNLDWLIRQQKPLKNRFIAHDEISRIVCEFEDTSQAAQFHTCLKYSMARLDHVRPTMEPTDARIVNLDVNCDVIELFDPNRPGLISISRQHGYSFRFSYRQMYTGSTMQGNITEGALHHTQCVIRIFEALPQLSLSRVHELLHTEEDFYRFNTMIIKEKAEVIR